METSKYRSFDGITYSTINLMELEGDIRINAEYYDKIYLKNEEVIKKKNWDSLRNLADEIVNFGAYSLCNLIEYQNKGVPYLFVGNIKPNLIDDIDIKYINSEVHKILKKSQIFERDVLLTIAGTIGNSAVVTRKYNNCNSNQAIAKIRKLQINPYYLSTFFNSSFGKLQSHRFIVSNVQPNLLLRQVKRLKIPIPSEEFQKKIEEILKEADNRNEQLKIIKEETNEIFLAKLGLIKWKTKMREIDICGVKFEIEENISIRQFREYQEKNRLDPEYWDLKYDELKDLVERKVELIPLKEFLKDFRKGVEVGSDNYTDTGKPFIRVSNLSRDGFNDNNQQFIEEELYEELKEKFQPRIQEILLTKDATPGIAYLMKEEVSGIISSGIMRMQIDPEKIDSEFLTLCINSTFGQYQIRQEGGGSVITHWKPYQIKNLLIPNLEKEIQNQISAKLREAYEILKYSNKLRNAAIRCVELFILKNEEEGIDYIHNTIDGNN